MRQGSAGEWYEALAEARRLQSLTVLVGSAISKFPPTSLATGGEAATEIRRLLLEDFLPNGKAEQDRRTRLKWLIEDFPFESVMAGFARVASVGEADSLVRQLFAVRGHNAVHEMLARLMLERGATGVARDPAFVIVTTNYDCGIENACVVIVSSCPTCARYRRVVREQDLSAGSWGWPILYKIHGSVDCDAPMVYTHDQEARLDRWKYRLLRDCVDGRTLLILGYSGRDLDVFPALNTCDPMKVLAPRRPRRLRDDPHGFRHLLEKLWVLGDDDTDLRVPLEFLTSGTPPPELHRAQERRPVERLARVRSTFRNVLTKKESRRWLGHLLVHTGAWEDGLRVLESIESDPARPSLLFEQERADALYYAGRYASAAEARRVLLGREEFRAPSERRLRTRNSQAASLNCAGDAIGAWKALLTGVPDLLRLLLLRQGTTARAAATELVFTALQCIPFLTFAPLYRPIAEAFSRALRRVGSIGPALVVERTIKSTAAEGSFAYIILGQRTAQVNVYRYRADAYTARYRRTKAAADAAEAGRYWARSARFAQAVGDNPGLAKACFGLTQLYMLQGKEKQPHADRWWMEAWTHAKAIELVGWRRATAHLLRAWADQMADGRARRFGLRTVRSLAGGTFSVR